MPKPVDALIEARWIIPVEPARTVLSNHTIAISDGRIVAVLPTDQARVDYAATQHVMLPEHALIPGLVNLHTHAAMSLMRGLADDIALMDWLKLHIWPAEMRHMSPEFVYDGVRLACAEMLRAGITCFSDMYFFPQAVARVAVEAQMRAMVGLIVIDFPSPYAADAQDYLNKGLALRDEMRDVPLVKFCLAPHAPYTVSDKTLKQVATYADELDLPIHTHIHETQDEIKQSLQDHGVRPLHRLNQLGLLGPGFIGVHAVHLDTSDVALLAQHGCHVAHCPSSNLKLASGVAPIKELLTAGVNIGLGTDGAASNNRLDLFTEMRTAALLAKGISGDATVLPAWQVLEMATLAGARAIGMDGLIGTLAPGKRADITALRYSGPEVEPCYDPLSHLIYSIGREHVSHVWVDGKLVVENGNLTTLNTAAIQARSNYWRDRMRNA